MTRYFPKETVTLFIDHFGSYLKSIVWTRRVKICALAIAGGHKRIAVIGRELVFLLYLYCNIWLANMHHVNKPLFGRTSCCLHDECKHTRNICNRRQPIDAIHF